MTDIIKPLQDAWNNVKEQMCKRTDIAQYWSEHDLLHSIATLYEENLKDAGIQDFIIHVSSSITPRVLEGELSKNLQKYLNKHRERNISPDLIVHKTDDVEHLFELCAEIK